MGGLLTDGRCLVLFAKHPVRGKVKTRLARDIGEERATSLYDALLRDSLERCRAVRARTALAYSPASGTAFFAALAPEALLFLQPEGDLGARLRSAFALAFELGFERVVAVGSDAPQVPAAWIDEAFERLSDTPLAIGPARDGGYWSIGLSRPAPRLFEGIRWSTAFVRGDTEARAKDLRIEPAILREADDVDTLADLERLREHLAAKAGDCAHTRAWLGDI